MKSGLPRTGREGRSHCRGALHLAAAALGWERTRGWAWGSLLLSPLALVLQLCSLEPQGSAGRKVQHPRAPIQGQLAPVPCSLWVTRASCPLAVFGRRGNSVSRGGLCAEVDLLLQQKRALGSASSRECPAWSWGPGCPGRGTAELRRVCQASGPHWTRGAKQRHSWGLAGSAPSEPCMGRGAGCTPGLLPQLHFPKRETEASGPPRVGGGEPLPAR